MLRISLSFMDVSHSMQWRFIDTLVGNSSNMPVWGLCDRALTLNFLRRSGLLRILDWLTIHILYIHICFYVRKGPIGRLFYLVRTPQQHKPNPSQSLPNIAPNERYTKYFLRSRNIINAKILVRANVMTDKKSKHRDQDQQSWHEHPRRTCVGTPVTR